MTTITATPDTATGSVTLQLTQTSSVARVTRSNANGVSDVRVATGQLPSAATGTTIITDYEAAHGVNNYTAYVTDVATRTNLATNPRPVGTTDYLGPSPTSTSFSTGKSAVQATASGTGTAYLWSARSIDAIAAGEAVALSALVEFSTEIKSVNIKAHRRSTNEYFSSGQVVGWDPTGKGVHRVSVLFTAPSAIAANDLDLTVLFYTTGGATAPAGSWARMGELLIEKSTTALPFFDGATPDTTDVDYAWTGTANASTSTEATTTRQVTASATLTIDKPWLLVPIAPNYSAQIESIPNYSAARETNSTVHTIIGRADPLVVLGKLGLRSGTLEIWTASLESAGNLARVFDRGEAVFLKQTVPGMDMYFVAESLDVDPYEAAGDLTRYRFTVRYREVTRPYGDLAGALGWTFDALAASYSSFDAVSAAFATFDDLTIGDTL